MAKEIAHNERAHAILSASGSSRWLNCTPSARLEAEMPDSTSSYAEEGTLAHEISEIKLRLLDSYKGTKEHKALIARLGKAMKSEYYDLAMDAYTDTYVEYVRETFCEAIARDIAAHMETEIRVDLGKYIPEGFGSVDNVVIGGGILDVIDLKYGKGIAVSAVDNSQLKLYALGVLEAFSFLYDIDTVRLHIHQPRLDTVSVFEISAEDLLGWGEKVVLPTADKAFKGEGEQVPGNWCGFCKVRNRCKALAEEAHKVAALDFVEPKLLSDEQLQEVFAMADRMTRWLSGLGDYMLQEALAGKKWEGWKLVEGRSNRQISSEDKAIEQLTKAGYTEADFMNMKLQGIGALEKLLGKTDFERVLGSVIVKPDGKPTLVTADDKRPELNRADDFND